MRRYKPILMLAALGVFLTCVQQANAAVALVQKVRNPPPPMETLGVTSTTVSYTNPPTATNLLVAIVAGDISAGPLAEQSGTWTQVVNQLFTFDGTAQIPSQAIFFKVSTGAGDQNVTFTYTNDTDANISIQLLEYSGLVAVNPLESFGSNSGHNDVDGGTAGFQANSGSVSPFTTPALLIAGFAGRPLNASPLINNGTGNGIFSAYTNSFVEENNASAPDVPCDDADPGCYGFSSIDQVTNTFASFTSNATFTDQKNGTSTTGGWRGQIVAFRPASVTSANATVSGRILDDDGNPIAGAAIRMSGSQNRLTITDALGNYHFDNVATGGTYTVTPARANYSFSPSQRAFSQLGNHTDAAFVGSFNGGGQSPLDTDTYFVRQQYLDFLGREPDEAGFNFWVNGIESCGSDVQCREVARINTSAAFFLSIEFQQTGYLVYRMYDAAYGEMANAPVPLTLSQFKPDTQTIGRNVIVNQSGWEDTLAQNKEAYAADFVGRAQFTSAYATTLTPGAFVDQLFANAQVAPTDSERAAALAEFGGAADTSDVAARARVLRRVAETSTLTQKEFNSAFVLMQYYGYLQRDPNRGIDTNFDGYNYWLGKLDQFHGNYIQAEMVKSFLVSTEYRGRFTR